MQATSVLKDKKILLGISGGVAAYKSILLLRLLIKAGAQVQVIMTESAQQFVAPLTFQALTTYAVRTDLFDNQAEQAMGHIELARWADLIVIAPASANTLAKIAQGMADNLLTTLILAATAPKLVCPAMNVHMWQNVATQRNVQQLQQDGIAVVMPAIGEMACGDVGEGRLPEADDIFARIESLFIKQHKNAAMPVVSMQGKNVLITAGPTQESIDPVRYISNHSSGKMGFAIAQAFADAGAAVTLVAGPVTLPTPNGVKLINVLTADEMLHACMNEVTYSDIFVATAAVADYKVKQQASHKIKKKDEEMHVTLVKNPDILASIAALPNKPLCVGFAAETHEVQQYAQAKLTAKKLDMIVCNDVSRSDIGFGSEHNAVHLFFAPQYHKSEIFIDKSTKTEVAKQLVVQVASLISAR